MEYNIGFVVGDPSGDGHACTTDYHIVKNIFKTSYDQAMALNAAIAEDIEDSKPNVCLQVREV